MGLLLVGLVFWVIGKFLTDFVVPTMYLRHSLCLDAWREVLRLLTS